MAEFTPTKTQRLAKARFWQKLESNPLVDVRCLTDHDIGVMAETTQLPKWKADPDFLMWFTDDTTVDAEIEAGVEVAVKRLLEIIETRDVGPREAVTTTHQLAAAKMLLEYSSLAKPAETESTPTQLPDDVRKLKEVIETELLKRQSTLTVAGVPDE